MRKKYDKKNAHFVVISGPRNAVKTEAGSSGIFVQIVESISKGKDIKHTPNQSKYGINTFGSGRHYLIYQNDIIEV
ncbi:MAG TPA: hypothetical protein DHW42_03685 [Candidatus Marinimicrobia bacterium]|nr:hypothetical protein [Candidatus Neomarinimicrobiota bacterium]